LREQNRITQWRSLGKSSRKYRITRHCWLDNHHQWRS